jgi:hypothetical protein
MSAIVLGIAMMISSGGAALAVQTSPVTIPPGVFSQQFATDAAVLSRALPRGGLHERSRALWRDASSLSAQSTAPKRFSKTDRIIAVAAGVSLGWILGGVTGGRLTESSNPDDDTSALKGIMIGAPIGAVAGAIIAYRSTR